MNLITMIKPFLSKMLPKVRESLEARPLDRNAGEFANVIMIQIGEDEEGKELPLDFHIVTLAKIEGRDLPVITGIHIMEGL